MIRRNNYIVKLFGALGASMLGNKLNGKGVVRTRIGYDII